MIISPLSFSYGIPDNFNKLLFTTSNYIQEGSLLLSINSISLEFNLKKSKILSLHFLIFLGYRAFTTFMSLG